MSEGDTFIPDVLGIRTSTSTISSASGGRIRAGTITNSGANGAPNFPNGLTGTAGTFTGNLNVGGVLTYEDVTNVDSIGVITARAAVSIADSIVHTGDTNTSLRFPTADTITAETGGLERVRIDSSGNFMINSTSAEAKLDVTGGVSISSNGVTVTPSGYDLKIRSNTGKLGIHIDNASGTPTLEFGIGGATGGAITTNSTGPIVLKPNNSERLRITHNGEIGIGGANYGTSGQFLQSQGSGSAVQWASADFVKIATATWTSAISSVTIDNLDTATYKYFRLLFNTVPSDQGRRLSFRWRKDGSDQTGAAYDWNFGETYGSSTSTLAENADKGEVTDDMGNDAWEGCQLEFVIYPKSSAESGYQGNTVFWHGIHYENAGYVRGINGSLFYDGGASLYLNGFKLYMNVGNLATGDYALYGVKR